MIFDKIAYEYTEPRRIVVIGDIHGDIKRFKNILIDAALINNDLEWVAQPPETIVVQVGDQIDSANRNPDIPDWEVLDDVNMLYFTNSLDNIAREKGGRVISLIGNHELMNTIGNFSYVSKQSLFENRAKFFMPTGTISPILAKRPIVLKIGQLFFCHAGVKKVHLDILDKHGKHISHLNELWSRFIRTGKLVRDDGVVDKGDIEIFNSVVLDGENGILWTRTIDTEEDAKYVLDKLGCKFVFIGHSPAEGIKFVNNRLWLTDNGISRAFATSEYQYIDILDYHIRIRKIIDSDSNSNSNSN
jgi:hypothetical protein